MPHASVLALYGDDPGRGDAPCGYLTTTPDGLITEVNSLLLEMAGRSPGELPGRLMFADLLTAGGQIFHETQFAAMLQSVGGAQEVAFDLARPDGTTVPVLVNAVLDRDRTGRATAVRMAVFEATARRHYERDLLEARRRAEASERRAVSLARTLQQTLIPPAPPVVPGLEVAAAYRPAGSGDEVGGDFYDVFELEPGRWAVAIGDVCGKGVEAAVVTALARHTLRAAAVGMDRPSQALRVLNDALLRAESERFCTVCLVLLEQTDDGWTLTVSTGGHPLPVVARADGSVTTAGRPGALLGVLRVLDDEALRDEVVTLGPGDAVVCYTDGVTEARRAGELYGERRVVERVAATPRRAQSMVGILLDEALAFQHGDPRDDIAVVALSVPGPGGPEDAH